MNDLDTLRVALRHDAPSQDVVDRSRHRLQNRIRGRGTSTRIRPLTIGAGLTLTAAAAALAVTVLPADSPPPTGATAASSETGVPTRTVTGQEILLAAATAAERAPEGSGSYWYVAVTLVDDKYEYWTNNDGRSWFRGRKTNGQVMPLERAPKPFRLPGLAMTLDELNALPTDPVALPAWIAEAMESSDARTSAGPLTASDREMLTFHSLISLVSTLPAPPEVRAAAFRAIAAYPGVESLGAVPGGQGLRLPDGGPRIVVDPETGRMNGTSVYVTVDGAVYGVSGPEGARISAEWTDTLPE